MHSSMQNAQRLYESLKHSDLVHNWNEKKNANAYKLKKRFNASIVKSIPSAASRKRVRFHAYELVNTNKLLKFFLSSDLIFIFEQKMNKFLYVAYCIVWSFRLLGWNAHEVEHFYINFFVTTHEDNTRHKLC